MDQSCIKLSILSNIVANLIITVTAILYHIKNKFTFIFLMCIQQQMLEDHKVCEVTSRSAAAISLTFIVLVTPWAIQQVITSCTGTLVSMCACVVCDQPIYTSKWCKLICTNFPFISCHCRHHLWLILWSLGYHRHIDSCHLSFIGRWIQNFAELCSDPASIM